MLAVALEYDIYLAPGPVVLDRVGQQVQKHLFQAYVVGHDGEAAEIGFIEIDRNVVVLRQRYDPVHAVGQHLSERNRLQRYPGISGLDAGQIQDLVDQRHQVSAGAVDLGGIGQMLLVEFAIVDKQLRKTEDRIQRRAQLVAHTGEEFGFGLVGLLGLVLGLDQRGLGSLALGDILVDRDHPFPGLFVTSHDGHQGTGFKVGIVDSRIDPFRFVILFFTGQRGYLGGVVFHPLRVPPAIDIGLDSEKLFPGLGFVQPDQGLVDIGYARLPDHFAQDARVLEEILFQILDPLELQLVDDFLDRRIVFFLHPERHLLEQRIVTPLAFPERLDRQLRVGNILHHAKAAHYPAVVVE